MTNGLILLAVIIGVPAFICWLLFGRSKAGDTATYLCTRCERHFASPDIPLNSRCNACGGGVQPR